MFHFRLQNVLDVRERITRLRQKDYAHVEAQVQGLADQVDDLQTAKARAARDMDETNATAPSVFALQQYQAFRQRVKHQVALLHEQMRELQQELDARRAALVEARRAQRALEILRDKARRRHEEAEGRRERAAMDEVAANYHTYRQL